MKPITKSISYGYSESVQLFVDGLTESVESFELGVLGVQKKVKEQVKEQVFVVVVSKYDNGDLYNLAEYRYDDYLKAVEHFHKIVLNFCFADLYHK